jgi:hypothetical protein
MKTFPLLCGITTSLLATLGIVANAQAGIIRHDVNDSDYLTRANLYPSVGRLQLIYNDYDLTGSVGTCSGTLISPKLVLTAAHCLYNNNDYFLRSGFLTFGNADTSYDAVYPIHSAVVKREYLPTIADSGFEFASKQGFDIAIISLLREVPNLIPEVPHPRVAQLYTSTDESNRVGTYVGFGNTGNGKDGLTSGSAGIKRAGRNRVKVVDSNLLGSDFDKPSPHPRVDEFLYLCRTAIWISPQCDEAQDFVNYRDIFDNNSIPFPDEYLVAGGDSGGALFIGLGSSIKLAGVISATDDGDGDGSEDKYRDINYATRVSSWVNWITNVESYLSSNPLPNPQSYTFVPNDNGNSVITPDAVRVIPRSDFTLMPLEPGYDELYNVALLADIFSNAQDSIFIPGAIPGTVINTNPDPDLTAAVPEPSTIAGLALAGISLGYFRRRQRR